ncbi:ABC transporter permease [Wenzhouxiangella sp. AB-CW3]|uniref:ABC transporter permease n=1 Tax=Wenzhouxiangella sp. AB-CW3 TaxID=2771012 RepID=UPI00168C091F|nr:ABC transporter permease [Wenzhouxiangella sp. AB-CW3]QOC22617.1 ABC transporter permease [Wenzhouxiangella sp. AB-CW3]
MNLFGLALRSLINRRFAVVLTVLTIALSIGLLVLVEQMRSEVRDGFYRSVSGTDLIVGARTAPIQLLLYSVFGIGDATNNVSWQTYQELAGTSDVAWAIPMALGDMHRGYRVMGTSDALFEYFRYGDRRALEFAEGQAFDDLFDVVVGHQVARQLGYDIADRIVLSHGTGSTALQQHEDHPFTISGILAPTGTPVDQTLYISLPAHRAIHIGWERGTRMPGAEIDPDQARERAGELHPESVTAVLLGLQTRAAVFGLQRRINDYRAEALTAIMPGITLQELWRITGLAEQILRVVAGMVVLAGLLGMLTVLLTTLNERRREMAILRANGARPWQIAGLLVFEAGLIAACGIIAGVALALLAQALAAPWLLTTFGLHVVASWPAGALWLVLAGILGAGLAIGLVPALMAYRRTLADGMQVRM